MTSSTDVSPEASTASPASDPTPSTSAPGSAGTAGTAGTAPTAGTAAGTPIAVNDIGSEEAFLAAIDETIKYFNDGDIV
ncbi:MAG TPA: hypothetical protein VFX15_04640, partial [Actinomycetes bacterium]|nr:hypothetical protein [Actinomycetes bacterium]